MKRQHGHIGSRQKTVPDCRNAEDDVREWSSRIVTTLPTSTRDWTRDLAIWAGQEVGSAAHLQQMDLKSEIGASKTRQTHWKQRLSMLRQRR